MYSKEKGVTYAPQRPVTGGQRPSYYRGRTGRVQVPPNYSGHALSGGEEGLSGAALHFGDPSSASLNGGELPLPPPPTPHFEGLPRVRGLVRRDPPVTATAAMTAMVEEARSSTGDAVFPTEEARPSTEDIDPPAPMGEITRPSSLPTVTSTSDAPSLRDSLFSLLANGQWLEELLLLGLMLFLLREGEGEEEGDLKETVILLGLLLLLG